MKGNSDRQTDRQTQLKAYGQAVGRTYYIQTARKSGSQKDGQRRYATKTVPISCMFQNVPCGTGNVCEMQYIDCHLKKPCNPEPVCVPAPGALFHISIVPFFFVTIFYI